MTLRTSLARTPALLCLFVAACTSPPSAKLPERELSVQGSQAKDTHSDRPCRPPMPSGAAGQGNFVPPAFSRNKNVIRAQFDANADGRLDRAERDKARAFLENERKASMGRGGFPGPPPGGNGEKPRGPFAALGNPSPGPWITLSAIAPLPKGTPLYAPATMRTLWLEFDENDWEDEMAAFHDTDVELPARLVVDGVTYDDIGVRFRGMSSFGMVPAGFKRSLAVPLDAFKKQTRLLGYRSLNLLNSANDPTFMRSILSLEIARHYVPAPRANHVRVVINGSSWGVYVNAQQVNQDFIKEWFGSTEGRWWKVPGTPGGRGSLAYLGEDAKSYQETYQLKSRKVPDAYRDLIRLCRVLAQTKPEALEQALLPLLDIDEALRFLALENLLINSDGYFLRTSDYYLYQGKDGRFSVIPHDVNETLNALEGGPGMKGDVGVQLDPLVAAQDPEKPLLSKLLAVPKLRAKYLSFVREMAETWLDWNKLGPIVEAHQQAIAEEVARDTRKLSSTAAFSRGVTENSTHEHPCGSRLSYGLKPFVEARRAYLLNHPAIVNAAGVQK